MVNILSWEDNELRASAVRAALREPYPNGLLCIAEFGLWDGVHHCYADPDPRQAIGDRLYSNYEASWFVEDGELKCTEVHHDGTNYHRYRRWRAGVSECRKEHLLQSILNGTLDEQELDKCTCKIGNDVLKKLRDADIELAEEVA